MLSRGRCREILRGGIASQYPVPWVLSLHLQALPLLRGASRGAGSKQRPAGPAVAAGCGMAAGLELGIHSTDRNSCRNPSLPPLSSARSPQSCPWPASPSM